MDLSKVSTEDLQKELDRRGEATADRPQIKEHIHWDYVIKHAENMINNIIKNGNPGKYYRQYTFESVLEAIYGSNVWAWWNTYNDG